MVVCQVSCSYNLATKKEEAQTGAFITQGGKLYREQKKNNVFLVISKTTL